MRSVFWEDRFFLLFNISIRRGRLVPCTCLSKQMSSVCYYSCSWLCYGVCDKMITRLFLLRSVCRWGSGCRNASPTLHCQGKEAISAQGLGLQCPRKLGIFSDRRGLRCNVRCSPAGILEALSRGRNESRTQYSSASLLFLVVQKHPSIVH